MTQRQPYHWMDGDVHQIGYKAEDQYGKQITRIVYPDPTDQILMQDRYNPMTLTWILETQITPYYGDNEPPRPPYSEWKTLEQFLATPPNQ